MKNKKLIIIIVCFILIILAFGLLLNNIFIKRIIEVNEMPEYFADIEILENPIHSDVISDSKGAVKYVKIAIKSVYNESPLQHRKYYVYFDSANGLYYIWVASYFYLPGVRVVINKNDGRIVYIIHGK